MPQQSIEIVRGNFEAWNRGDNELRAYVAEHLAPDVTLQPFGDFADSQIRHGREEVLRLWMELRQPWERLAVEKVDVVEAGGYVVAGMLARGVMKGTEDEVEMEAASTHVLREGKIAEIRYYRTFAEALEAAGRQEQTGSQS